MEWYQVTGELVGAIIGLKYLLDRYNYYGEYRERKKSEKESNFKTQESNFKTQEKNAKAQEKEDSPPNINIKHRGDCWYVID